MASVDQLLKKTRTLLRQIRGTLSIVKRSSKPFNVLFVAVVLLALVAFMESGLSLLGMEGITENLLGEDRGPQLKKWLPRILVMISSLLIGWVVWRTWRLSVATPPLPDNEVKTNVIKGPMAFVEQDGELFRRLQREEELRTLVAHVKNDQIGLAVVMGESGAGKNVAIAGRLVQCAGHRADRISVLGGAAHVSRCWPVEGGPGQLANSRL